ncbi:hypothetical protein [Pedobacter frigidisoli]|nr:hypothetical protein [Pedobacter frigidisoli]
MMAIKVEDDLDQHEILANKPTLYIAFTSLGLCTKKLPLCHTYN